MARCGGKVVGGWFSNGLGGDMSPPYPRSMPQRGTGHRAHTHAPTDPRQAPDAAQPRRVAFGNGCRHIGAAECLVIAMQVC